MQNIFIGLANADANVLSMEISGKFRFDVICCPY